MMKLKNVLLEIEPSTKQFYFEVQQQISWTKIHAVKSRNNKFACSTE